MLVIRRKNIIIGLLVVLLIITGYLNFVFNQNSAPTVSTGDNAPTAKPDTSKGTIKVTDLEEADVEPDDDSNAKDKDATESLAAASSSFFRDYRFEREQDRSKEVAYINTIVDNPNSDPEMIKEAQSQLLEITSNMDSELAIENLIKAKGFRDAVVIIHKDNVNVIVDKAELVPEDVAIILDIVKRESGRDVENIKIIPKI
jgi:stage III sporulation protein AH